jgi:hypothetical protein
MAVSNFQFILEKDHEDVAQRNRPVNRKFQCSLCNAYFYRINQFFEHLQTVHECACGATLEDLTKHECCEPTRQLVGGNSRPFQSTALDLGVFGIKSQAHSGAILLFDVYFTASILTFEDAFEYIYPSLLVLIPQLLRQQRGVQVSFTLDTILERLKDGHTIERKFFSPYATILNENFIRSRIDASLQYLTLSLSLYQEGESGWRLKDVRGLEFKVVSYKPDLRKGRGFIETPKELRRCKILNIKSKSDNCFLLHMLAGLYGHLITLPDAPDSLWHELNKNQKSRLKRLQEKESSYLKIYNSINKKNSIDFSDFRGGVRISEIPSFEARFSVSINVFEYSNAEVFPIYQSQIKSSQQVNLLFLTAKENGTDIFHYCLIKNLGSLAQRKNHHAKSACFYCFHRYKEGSLRHLKLCQKSNSKRVSFPKDDSAVFDQFHMYLPVNFKIFYTLFPGSTTYMPEDPQLKYTTLEGNRHVRGFAMAVFDCDHQITFRTSYFGPVAMEYFIRALVEQTEKANKLTHNQLITINGKNYKEDLKDVKMCAVCKQTFNSSDSPPHMHHHHLSLRLEYFKV